MQKSVKDKGVSLCVSVIPQIWDVNILILPLKNGSNIVHDAEPSFAKASERFWPNDYVLCIYIVESKIRNFLLRILSLKIIFRHALHRVGDR